MNVLDFLRHLGPSDLRSILIVRNAKRIGKFSLATMLLAYGYGVLKNTGSFAAKQGYTFVVTNSIDHDRSSAIEQISQEMLQKYINIKNGIIPHSSILNAQNKPANSKFMVGFGITYCIEDPESNTLFEVSPKAWAQDNQRAMRNLRDLDLALDKDLTDKICHFIRENVNDEDVNKEFKTVGKDYWKQWLLPSYAGKRISNGLLCGLYHIAADIGFFSSYFYNRTIDVCK